MKNKKMLFIVIIAIIIVVAVVVAIILNKDKNKENNIDTDIDQNLFSEEELDPEEIELLNRQRTQEIRSIRK